jgi:dihydroorotase
MKALIKSATVIDKSSEFHYKKVDILVESGIIKKISETPLTDTADEVIEGDNLHVSIGWFDLKANFREPGEEWKETINSGTEAAKKGGFTGVALVPTTTNPTDNRSAIEFVKNRSINIGVNIYPYGAISKNLKGENLAELFDMHEAGAIGFTDNKKHLNSGLTSRALLYAKSNNLLINSFPYEYTISNLGQMHEGVASTKLGLKPIPSLAEELHIQRDLSLAEYHDTSIHFSTISTKKSVELIREAKAKGLKVTCDIAAHQLSFKDEDLSTYDTNFKVLPPFREQEDIDALIEGLKDGTIDAICSDHTPHDIESKKLEFEHADFGIIGLETAFGALNTALNNKIELATLIEKLTTNPRKIAKLSLPQIKVGEKAELTIFDPSLKWTYQETDIVSKSKNTPFIGIELIGKPIATIV